MVKAIRDISVIITLCCVVCVAVESGLLIHDMRGRLPVTQQALNNSLNSMQAIELNTTRTEAEMAGLLNVVRHIALQEQKDQQTQLAQFQLLTAKSVMLLGDADTTVKQLGYTAKSLDDIAPKAQMLLSSIQVDSHSTFLASNQLLDTAREDITTLDIQRTAGYMAQSAKNTSVATANIADTTGDIKDYVHRETTPVRGTWNFVKEMINLTWSVRGAVGF